MALNVALYGEKRGWAMTERGASALHRDRDRLVIGPSSMRWKGADLVISVREWGFPLPRRLVGEITVTPRVWGRQAFVLNEQGQHLWHPVAPLASVRLDFERPALSWRGTGYLDHNRGDQPIPEGFMDWSWQRAAHENGALVAYSGRRRDGRTFGFCVDFGRDGVEREQVLPPRRMLPRTLWHVPRIAHGEPGTRLLKTLEDTPFYSRSLIEMEHGGQRLETVQESLSLTRLTRPAVQMMLPFRMPRRG
ncbi:MAG: hydratase [Methylobacterium sp.]|nr:hydratase [Methylobacterium sp.]MCA3625097.1 hydratase [Methylobacterium sp.]